MATHQCEGCTSRIGLAKLLCDRCWAQVPAKLRNKVTRSYNHAHPLHLQTSSWKAKAAEAINSVGDKREIPEPVGIWVDEVDKLPNDFHGKLDRLEKRRRRSRDTA